MRSIRSFISAAIIAAALTFSPAASARQGALVKHTVSGTGTFEQGRGMRADVNRATFHPIDQHFALSVSGRMGWVITGQWKREGDEVLLFVSNMNNTPARGSGELKIDDRGNVESVKVSGTTRGGAYKVRFKATASSASPPPAVRLGPGSIAELPGSPLDGFDRTRRGRGALTFSGAAPIYLRTAEVEVSRSGQVFVRTDGAGATYRFEGTAVASELREDLDLVLHSSSSGGVVTGTARMDRSGRGVEHLALQGWLGNRPFQLDFRAGR